MLFMESSVITTKGQIVIPKAIREKYKLKPGTKVFFEDTDAGVILKHIDAAFIKSLRGMIPRTKDEKPMRDWWQEYKDEESSQEERKLSVAGEPGRTYKKAVKIKRKK